MAVVYHVVIFVAAVAAIVTSYITIMAYLAG